MFNHGPGLIPIPQDPYFKTRSEDAFICSFECTFCLTCAGAKLHFVCPNCGGALVRRPTRPDHLLAEHPASAERVLK